LTQINGTFYLHFRLYVQHIGEIENVPELAPGDQNPGLLGEKEAQTAKKS